MLSLAFADGQAPTAAARRKVNEWLDDCGEVIARAYSLNNLHCIEWPGLAIFAFSPASREVRVWPEPGVGHKDVAEAFFRVLQPIILQALGRQALHAAAVIGPTGVVAFCGRKGSGKSTLAFAMHRVGWRQFADDALSVRLDRYCVMVFPLPFTPRLRPESRAHFARTGGPVLSYPEVQVTDRPLKSVFLLQQNAGLTSPRVSLVQRSRAFAALLGYAHCFDAEDAMHTRQFVEDYLELVSRVQVFTLAYPPDLERLPELTSIIMTTVVNTDPCSVSLVGFDKDPGVEASSADQQLDLASSAPRPPMKVRPRSAGSKVAIKES
jgi:hypothetical protein